VSQEEGPDDFASMLGSLHTSETFHFQGQQRQTTGTFLETNEFRGGIGINYRILPPLLVHIIGIPNHVLNNPGVPLFIPFLESLELLPVTFAMKVANVIMACEGMLAKCKGNGKVDSPDNSNDSGVRLRIKRKCNARDIHLLLKELVSIDYPFATVLPRRPEIW
jgi:hypothetical protein